MPTPRASSAEGNAKYTNLSRHNFTPTNERKNMARKKGNKTQNMTQISISLPQNLVAEIDSMAASENRNRSNFISNTLQNMAKEYAERLGK